MESRKVIILNVAEKPSVAKGISEILSQGQQMEKVSVYDKVVLAAFKVEVQSDFPI